VVCGGLSPLSPSCTVGLRLSFPYQDGFSLCSCGRPRWGGYRAEMRGDEWRRVEGQGGRGKGDWGSCGFCWMFVVDGSLRFCFPSWGLGVYFGVGWRGEGMSGWEGLRGGEKMSG